MTTEATTRLAAARDLALRLMAEHGLHDWEFRFNTNVRRAGVCKYPRAANPVRPARRGRIELSAHFVAHNPDEEVRDTILHEIAHALVGAGYGHGEVWKAKCKAIGAKPNPYCGEGIEMPKGRWRAICPGCRKEYDRHRRPPRLTGWFCRPCGRDRGALTWTVA